jgi:predicted AAA+ superfamily ATPase
VKLLAARSGNKVDHTKLGSMSGIPRQKLGAYLQLLEQTYLIYQLPPFTKNIDKEISQQKKLYFADNGLLNTMGEGRLSSSQLFENAVAAQLKPLGTLQYYLKKTGQEIDFIFRQEMAIEVKETPIAQDKQSLSQKAAVIGITKNWVAGLHPSPNGFQNFLWAGSIF